MSQLTPRQAAFIREYLLDFNATAAAQRAGYGGDSGTLAVVGAQNLANPAIRERLNQHLHDVALNARQILDRLANHARGSMADFVSQSSSGEIEIDLAKALSLGAMDRVRFLVFDERRDDDGFLLRRRVEISLHDSLAALIQLLKAYQLPEGALAKAFQTLTAAEQTGTPEEIFCNQLDTLRHSFVSYYREYGEFPPIPH